MNAKLGMQSHGIAHQERNKTKYMNVMAEILKVGKQVTYFLQSSWSHPLLHHQSNMKPTISCFVADIVHHKPR